MEETPGQTVPESVIHSCPALRRDQVPRWAGLLVLVLLLLVAAGCVHHQPVINDLVSLSQKPTDYVGDRPDAVLGSSRFMRLQEQKYLERYFAPWKDQLRPPDRDDLENTIERAEKYPGYGENMLPHDPRWIGKVAGEMDIESFPSLLLKAITLRETSARGFPTHRPRFLAFTRPGEGFPFDYWQKSLLFGNTPLRVLHATRSGDWLYVQAPFVSGWVPSHDVGLIEPDDIHHFQSGDFLVPLRDGVPLHDEEGRFLFNLRIGSLLPVQHADNGKYTVLVAIPAEGSQTTLRRGKVLADHFAPFPVTPTAGTIAATADAMSGSPYGWGGMYGNRDCSAFLKDLFAGFGLWLPRNSYWQAHEGNDAINLAHLSARDKERYILDHGIPFVTLLWMPGHIMLYVGEKNGRAMALHVMWGLRSNTCFFGEGRIIVGGMAITSLTPGVELTEVPLKSLLINQIEAMRVLIPGNEISADNSRKR